MNKKIKITEDDLIKIVNIVKENINLNDYSDEDFIEVFVTLFRPWVKQNHGDEIGEYPMSFLIKKHYDEFAKYYGIDNDRYWGSGMSKLVKIGRAIVEKGRHKLPNLSKTEKFTEKYGKGIEILVKNLDLPDFVTIKIEEERPYDVWVRTYVDFEKYVKSDLDNTQIQQIKRAGDELRKSFENFLGVTYGNPSHGLLKYHSNSTAEMVGEDEWVKKELNKKIKKEIKQLPGGSGIHMIKYESGNNRIKLKLVFRNSTGWSSQRNVKESTINLLRDLGYNPNIIEVYA